MASQQAVQDITPILLVHREAVRHLWNTALRDGANWDTRDEFEDVCARLLRLAIADGMRTLLQAAPSRESPALCVVPAIATGTPIMINRTDGRSAYWDDPVDRVVADDVELSFERFFDWDELGYRDFEFIAVRITRFVKQPHLEGRSALIAASHVRVPAIF